jgi:hypothetical protein
VSASRSNARASARARKASSAVPAGGCARPQAAAASSTRRATSSSAAAAEEGAPFAAAESRQRAAAASADAGSPDVEDGDGAPRDRALHVGAGLRVEPLDRGVEGRGPEPLPDARERARERGVADRAAPAVAREQRHHALPDREQVAAPRLRVLGGLWGRGDGEDAVGHGAAVAADRLEARDEGGAREERAVDAGVAVRADVDGREQDRPADRGEQAAEEILLGVGAVAEGPRPARAQVRRDEVDLGGRSQQRARVDGLLDEAREPLRREEEARRAHHAREARGEVRPALQVRVARAQEAPRVEPRVERDELGPPVLREERRDEGARARPRHDGPRGHAVRRPEPLEHPDREGAPGPVALDREAPRGGARGRGRRHRRSLAAAAVRPRPARAGRHLVGRVAACPHSGSPPGMIYDKITLAWPYIESP